MKHSIFAAILLAGTTGLTLAEDKVKKHPEREDVAGIDSKDPEMIAAQKKARDTLMTFVRAIQRPEANKRYLLKVKITEGGETEHVWLEPVKWNDPGLLGRLAVEPVAIKKHKKGDIIAPLPDEVSDWVILSKDGAKQGGYTTDVVEKRETESAKEK
ncbi:DUF2314 domain-containing protein [Brevifollis gellanilyticus]|uniref:DUF2314 domain-containing protein n=1 Tax=Brevifollis gellanilyticus TaxID=748831 RepID=A0A512M2K3_9BACT|nr:DUF2314 domain-containing protein [Brevifollis gellanilyticus]GEP40962.1 hypothetical protein BGE01nite_02530 [Brevifollis gellanilyticus]